MRRRERVWAVVIAVILTAVALAWIYPFIWTVGASFKDSNSVFSSPNPFTSTIHLDNWTRAWREADMGRYFANSVLVTGGSIIISVVTASLMGYALGRYRFRGRKVIFAALGLLIFLPEGYTIIPIYDLLTRLHLDNSLWGVLLAEAGGVNVIVVLLYAGFFQQIPHELEEAARVDGAGFLRIFARIFLPLAKPVTATAVILQFIGSWNDFLLPLVFTLTRPELRTLSVGVYALQNDYQSDWGVMTAASLIALLPVIIMFLFLQKYFISSIAGAIKG